MRIGRVSALNVDNRIFMLNRMVCNTNSLLTSTAKSARLSSNQFVIQTRGTMKKDLDLIQRVTANVFFWQGLRFVPLGFYLLFVAIHTAAPSWWPFTSGIIKEALP